MRILRREDCGTSQNNDFAEYLEDLHIKIRNPWRVSSWQTRNIFAYFILKRRFFGAIILRCFLFFFFLMLCCCGI